MTAATLAVDPFDRFIFAATTSNSIAVFRIYPNGSLHAVPGSPFPSDGAGSVAVDPYGRFLYVVGTTYVPTGGYNSPRGVVSVYNIVSNGYLRPVSGSPFYTGHDYAVSVKAESSGRFIYVGCDLESSVLTYRVASGGVLTQVLPTVFVGGPWSENLAYNPTDGHLYFTYDEDGLANFSLNPVTGLPETPTFPLFKVGLYNMENRPVGVCVSPNGKFVYIGNANIDVDPTSMSLRGFKVGSTGSLTEVPGSPYYPLGFTLDETQVQPSLGWPSSMVVAP